MHYQFVFCSVVLLLNGDATLGPVHGQESPRTVSATDPRPVAQALRELEIRHGWILTYEDPSYLFANDLMDVTKSVRKDYTTMSPKVIVPKTGSLAFTYWPGGSIEHAEQAAQLVANAQQGRTDGGQFRVIRSTGAVHVVPSARRSTRGQMESVEPVLNAVISTSTTEKTAIELIEEIVSAVNDVTGRKVLLAQIPIGPLRKTVALGPVATGIARELLLRVLHSVTPRASWQLMHSPAPEDAYYLSVHFVAPTRAPDGR